MINCHWKIEDCLGKDYCYRLARVTRRFFFEKSPRVHEKPPSKSSICGLVSIRVVIWDKKFSKLQEKEFRQF